MGRRHRAMSHMSKAGLMPGSPGQRSAEGLAGSGCRGGYEPTCRGFSAGWCGAVPIDTHKGRAIDRTSAASIWLLRLGRRVSRSALARMLQVSSQVPAASNAGSLRLPETRSARARQEPPVAGAAGTRCGAGAKRGNAEARKSGRDAYSCRPGGQPIGRASRSVSRSGDTGRHWLKYGLGISPSLYLRSRPRHNQKLGGSTCAH